ncbi:MAG: efflux RND transporter periplasmic adaptor subunit [Candidatus Magnetoovum sp. WYHC-5]|nr:efflux RND transporter periplasmic adaptor subunit [Candidatus Magnetoovum sp. WYHC-5]
MKKKIIILGIIILVATGGYFTYKHVTKKPTIEVLDTASVKRADLNDVIVVTGIVKPRVGAQVKIGTRATGVIDKMYVQVGDNVKKGQLIAKIDRREIESQVEELEAALNKAKTALEKIRLTYPRKIGEAKNDLGSASEKQRFSQAEMKRYDALLKQGFVSKNDFESKNSQYKQDMHDVAKADEALKRTQAEYKTEEGLAIDEVLQAQSNLDSAKVRLSYTDIISAIDGVVSDVTAQEGETIVAGLQVANLVTVLVPDLLEMWIYVDETDIGRIKKGLEVEYGVDTYPDKILISVVDRINPQPIVKDNIVYYIAIVNIDKKDALMLRPEMTTHVSIIVEKRQAVLTVPNGAVKFEEGKQVVYVLKAGADGGVQKITVKTGVRSEELTEIITGLKEGDVVATKLILPVDIDKRKEAEKDKGH